jgi:succinate dehydrogenase / fumarate reductase flavoprotein subunit
MSESLRNDGRVWVPKGAERDYFLERKYPAFGNLVPRDIACRNVKAQCDAGHGVGPGGRAVFLDLKESIARLGVDVIKERYGNLLDMYAKITAEDPYQTPLMIYPAAHYSMGGLWVDYNLMSNLPGLFVIGEANFSDHGANRLGASALMQGLADGYFILPCTIADYLAHADPHEGKIIDRGEFQQAETQASDITKKLLSIKGKTTVDAFHRELGHLLWDKCGMVRNEAGLKEALRKIPEIRERFWKDLCVLGHGEELNQALERAGRVADFLEFGELMCLDALERKESCGGHFREEYQTPEGEALRRDDLFSYVSAWQYNGVNQAPILHKEELKFEEVHLAQRDYK